MQNEKTSFKTSPAFHLLVQIQCVKQKLRPVAKRIVDAAKKEEDKMADERSAVEHHVIVSTLAPTQRGEGPGISISYCQAERGINNEVVINGAGPSIGTRAGIDNDVG